MSNTLTFAEVAEAMKKLGPPTTLWPLRIIADAAVPVIMPRRLTRWERFRVWFERLVDRAELTPEMFPWPRVQRTVTRPAAYLLLGRDLVMRPETFREFVRLTE